MAKSFFFIVAFICPGVFLPCADENPWVPDTGSPATLSKPDTHEPSGILNHFRETLEKTYEHHRRIAALENADLYPLALARIGEAAKLLAEKPGKAQTSEIFQVCSLICEAAYLQMLTAEIRAGTVKLQDNIASTLNELNAVHERINNIESSKAAGLKAQLDEEKRKALAMQEDANRKFDELQSELINVRKDARGTIISMSDILFDVGKATLTADLKTNLAKIAGILMVYRDANIIVEGHTDNTGGEEFNQRLSEERAMNVMNFLIEQGIEAARMHSTGYAFHRPIADNATAGGRQKNRRVDLVIQDKKLQ